MADTGLVNFHWAYSLIEGLVTAGVNRVVISPGSRSTPLVLACEQHPAMESWIQVDERSAAFFALGLARHYLQPTALVCTSGSAPAHWYPAVIEANHAGIPLLLLTADRPPELWDCGANQTIDQTHLFGSQVRAFHQLPPAESNKGQLDYVRQLGRRAVHESLLPTPGPVHINIPLREPLVPDNEELPKPSAIGSVMPVSSPILQPGPHQVQRLKTELSGRHGLIICGPDHFDEAFAIAVTRLAETLQCPILADPLSNLRFGPHHHSCIVSHYDAFLRRDSFTQAHPPTWVLRFGAMPVSSSLSNYLQQAGRGCMFLVDRYGRWRDPIHRVSELIIADPHKVCEELTALEPDPAPASWLEAFHHEENRAAGLADENGCIEAAIIQRLITRLPSGSILFSSNSMPIRDLDSFSGTGDKTVRIIANRGASGIDGNLSTLLGLAAAQQGTSSAGIVAGVVGDLAFYHDMNGLLAARDLDALIILFINGGGGIFYHLPQAKLPQFERDWFTPTGIDFEQVASLYNLHYSRARNADEFTAIMETALSHSGVRVIEVLIDPAVSLEHHRSYWDAVAAD